jgi:internalin A
MGKENAFKFLTQNNLAGMCIFEGQEEEQIEFKGLAEIKLNELESLNGLMLDHNNLRDISPLKELKELKALKYLGLSHNQITDISPLKELKELERLWIFDNKLTDISPLKELKKLWELGIGHNQITDISP